MTSFWNFIIFNNTIMFLCSTRRVASQLRRKKKPSGSILWVTCDSMSSLVALFCAWNRHRRKGMLMSEKYRGKKVGMERLHWPGWAVICEEFGCKVAYPRKVRWIHYLLVEHSFAIHQPYMVLLVRARELCSYGLYTSPGDTVRQWQSIGNIVAFRGNQYMLCGMRRAEDNLHDVKTVYHTLL